VVLGLDRTMISSMAIPTRMAPARESHQIAYQWAQLKLPA
jgi:hypothetical protein